MPFTSGTVSKFANTAIQGEVIDTGAPYSGTLANIPVAKRSFLVDYTIGGTPYRAADDGNGNIVGPGISAGSIDYATGAWSITYSPTDPTGGVTADYHVADGLLQAVLDFICGDYYKDEVLDTGDGSTLSFSGTLAHLPDVSKGQMHVSYTLGGKFFSTTNGAQAADDGLGVIEGWDRDLDPDVKLVDGTIDYATGAWALTFTAGNAPDNLTEITCDYVVGPDGQDWKVVMDQRRGSAIYGTKEVILQNSGLNGQELVAVGIGEYQHNGSNMYNWCLNGYMAIVRGESDWNFPQFKTSVDSGKDNIYTAHPTVPLTDSLMDYWIYANKQRLIVFVKTQAIKYESCYLGLGKRLGPPSTYQIPLFIGGCCYGTDNSESTASKHVGFWCFYNTTGSGTYYGAWVVLPGNQYSAIGGSTAQGPGKLYSYPYHGWIDSGVLYLTPDGDVVLFPNYIKNSVPDDILMELDGVYMCPSSHLIVEDTITVGAAAYRVFRATNKTDSRHLVAIRED